MIIDTDSFPNELYRMALLFARSRVLTPKILGSAIRQRGNLGGKKL